MTDVEKQERDAEVQQIGSDLPPAALSAVEMDPTSGVLFGIRSRMGLENETSLMRLWAFLGFSLIVGGLFVAVFFFGFDSNTEQLFIVSAPHLFLAPLLFYASIRFGVALVVVLVWSLLQAAIDGIALLFRIFTFTLTVEELVLLLFSAALFALALLYVVTTWRVSVVVRNQNQRAALALRSLSEAELAERAAFARTRLRQQEANTIRTTGVFGIVATLGALFTVLLFFSLDLAAAQLTIWSVGHLPVGLYAVFVGARGGLWTWLLLFFAVILMLLDLFELFIRLMLPETTIVARISLAAILNLLFLLINISFLPIGIVHFIGAFGFLYADTVQPEPFYLVQTARRYFVNTAANAQRGGGNHEMADGSIARLDAMAIRRRRK